MEVIRITRIDFDSLENSATDAMIRKTQATFAGDVGDKTAFGRAGDFIKRMPAQSHYLGWNGQIYPQFVVEKEEAQ